MQVFLSFIILFGLAVNSAPAASPPATTTSTTAAPPSTPSGETSAATLKQQNTPTTTTTATTSTAITTAITTTTTTSNENSSLAHKQKDLSEVKRAIQQHISSINIEENRLVMNKPTLAPTVSDFAPDSIEARLAEATTQFGLNFLNNLHQSSSSSSSSPTTSTKENTVISPISLQSLLNMILLGTSQNTPTHTELIKVLGYEATNLVAGAGATSSKNDTQTTTTNAGEQRLAHEAMRNVIDNIMRATHLAIEQPPLFNTNSNSLKSSGLDKDNTNKPTGGSISAHLQTLTGNQTGGTTATPLSGQVNFTLANLMLANRDLIELRPDYERDLKDFYKVNVESFSRRERGGQDQAAASASAEPAQKRPLHERVNAWVRNMTDNQIDQLANESDLAQDDLIMVLINAAHFKGRWLHTFNTKATTERLFYAGGDNSGQEVRFMRQKGVFGYGDFGTAALQAELGLGAPADTKTSPLEDAETLLTEDAATTTAQSAARAASNGAPTTSAGGPLAAPSEQQPPTIELSREEAKRMELTAKLNCSVLMLPFSLNDGQELSMVLLLPTKRNGLDQLQAALTAPALNEIYRSLSEQTVQVELPKFSFESSHDARKTLLRMGLEKIFGDSAELERMFQLGSGQSGAQTVPAKVDKVIHKAKITVDESGAEAAAASMASVVLRNFIRPPTPVFVADHPFLFVIRHNRSNMPLFMGRVNSPQAA